MAASLWTSSHLNYWIFDRNHLVQSRILDSKYASREELGWLSIWSANVIHKLAKRLSLRQQVTATAIVYFRRFYLKNSYSETAPCIVAAACLYVAAKVEELPVHIKSVVNEARLVFQEMGYHQFPSDNSKMAEMEFYLLEDLEFHLIVHHPYKSLTQMTGREDVRKENMMDLDDATLQMAWFIINDTYRTDLCLLYPPHMIAVASLYMALALNPSALTPAPSPRQVEKQPVLHVIPASPSKAAADSSTSVLYVKPPIQKLHPSLPSRPDFGSPAGPRASPANLPTPGAVSLGSSSASSPPATPVVTTAPPVKKLDPISFLSKLNVSSAMVHEIIQEITASYTIWKSYDSQIRRPSHASAATIPTVDEKIIKLLQQMRDAAALDAAHPSNAKPQVIAAPMKVAGPMK